MRMPPPRPQPQPEPAEPEPEPEPEPQPELEPQPEEPEQPQRLQITGEAEAQLRGLVAQLELDESQESAFRAALAENGEMARIRDLEVDLAVLEEDLQMNMEV